MNYNNVEFLISAASMQALPKRTMPEIVFAGKSNVGKSSVINRVLQRKNFARVGEKPGKTIHVNYFVVDKTCYFVDLPGYGYAKVSQAERDRWGRLIESYFAAGRVDLGVFIVDARHAPTQNDITMANFFIESGYPFVVVANKLDKLKKSQIEPNLQTIREDLGLPEECPVIPFSAEKGTGRDDLLKCIADTIQSLTNNKKHP